MLGRELEESGEISPPNTYSVEHGLYLQTAGRGLSRSQYIDFRMANVQHGLSDMPGWSATKSYRDKVIIKILKIT